MSRREPLRGTVQAAFLHGSESVSASVSLLFTRVLSALQGPIPIPIPIPIGLRSYLFRGFLGAAAELTATGGDQTGARRLLLRARELVDVTGECWCQSEIMRLEAALLAEGPTDRAELLRCALALAREQGSRLWQLRCATDLAELLRNQGEPDRAREMLAPVYDWFTEGLDSPDLRDARVLLDELG